MRKYGKNDNKMSGEKGWYSELMDWVDRITARLLKIVKWATGLSIILGVILFGYQVWASDETEKQDIDRYVASSNLELRYFKIEENPNPNPMFANDSIFASYIISLDNVKADDMYFFKSGEYVIETGGDMTQIPTADIFSSINKYFYYGDDNAAETIRKVRTDIELSLGGLGKVKFGSQDLLSELFVTIKGMINIKRKKVEILVKGFADGQKADWDRPLRPGKYHYDSVTYFPQMDSLSKNPTEYIRKEKVVSIPGKYKNIHLANLRGRFVKEDLIDPFIKNCSQNQYRLNWWQKGVSDAKNACSRNIDTKVVCHVLQGYTFSDANQPLNRRVQVYINIY